MWPKMTRRRVESDIGFACVRRGEAGALEVRDDSKCLAETKGIDV